ncbi:MAG: hypothetical protein H6Q31_1448 [Bacteroidetes bacterium]|nr:hypothetical protein [Bacteroidota bacterium]
MERFSTPESGSGGKLAKRRQTVGVKELLLGDLELFGALGDFDLKILGQRVEIINCSLQLHAHGVERVRQIPELLARRDLHGLVQIHRADSVCCLDQFVDGGVNVLPREHDENDDDQHGEHQRDEGCTLLDQTDFLVHRGEIQGHVYHSQNVCLGRMRVAFGIAACRLVIHRCDDTQCAFSRYLAEHACAGGNVNAYERTVRCMTDVASLCRLVNASGIAGSGGVHHAPFFVENPDPVDALLGGNGLHDLICGFAVVIEHGMPGGAGDAARELVRAGDHRVQQLIALRPHVNVP